MAHHLESFLKTYVYIPLGGNQKGEFRTYSNLLATFILGGIWHGAGWTFLFWGFLHGLGLVFFKIWDKFRFSLHHYLAWFITFNFINITWVFFRANEWKDAIKVLTAMFSIQDLKHILARHHDGLQVLVSHAQFDSDTAIMIAIGFVLILAFKNSNEINDKLLLKKDIPIHWYLLSIMMFGFSLIVMSLQTGSEFLYFNF